MKRAFLISTLVLILAFTGWAENSKSQAMQKDNFKIKPKLFWSTVSPIVINLDSNQWGMTVLNFDVSLMQYKNFHFLAAGVGIQTYQKKVIAYHFYYDYMGYPQSYYGEGYKFFFKTYLKLVPVKYRWNKASKIFKMDTYLEIGINPLKKEVMFGLTFSGNPFKKKKRG